MYGSIFGNIAGIGYFFAFQILGILLAFIIFQKQKISFSLLIGSVFGSFAIHWLPTIYAFLFNFTIRAHIFALATMIVLVLGVHYLTHTKSILAGRKFNFHIKQWFIENPALFLLLPLLIFTVVTLIHHTIAPHADGSFYSGQSTYGDMNMHLGFITSIAKQKTFPPEYSILPGTQLAYPFLSDSISSSVYVWGTSLRIAYILPMIFALIQVFFGMYLLAKTLLKGSRAKSFLAFVLFFFNGGFGFYYFITEGFGSENFTRIFTAFYETPTNYVQENIQWHNIICDMLIPQRATLFGWAMLFPVLILLVHALKEKDRRYWIVGGILAGGLPLIHTHSFLSLGILCAGFVVLELHNKIEKNPEKRWPLSVRLIVTMVALAIFVLLGNNKLSDAPLDANLILVFGLLIAGAYVCILVYHLIKGYTKDILLTWGLFLGIVLLFALPQLFGFTFRQAQGEQFVRGIFNWVNNMDGYLMFYIKNLGIMFILGILVLVLGTKRQIQLVMPAVFLWLLCEFIVFQPNTYDNNKILLVGYLYFSIAIADFVWDICKNRLRIVIVTGVTVLATFAAILTMGREYVSEYQLYNESYVKLCEWVEKNTKPKSTFLTHNNHNNAIASLTGRNIVCGSGSFLFYHGTNYRQNETDVKTMYEDPTRRDDLLDQYGVDYIVIGSYEMANYNIPDLQSMTEEYEIVYNDGSCIVLEVY